MNQEKINFYVDRDFGQTFNSSLKFLKQNFKLFFQCVLFIAGPFILIMAVSGAYFQAVLLQMSSFGRTGLFDSAALFGWVYFLYLFSAIIASLAILGTAYAYMIMYHEKGPANFSVSDVRKLLTKSIGHIVGTFFTLLLYILLAAVVLGGVGFILGSISTSLGVLYGVLILIGLLLIGPPIMWVMSSVYLIKMHEGGNAFFALGRARDVMKNNFWWTWLIIVCASLGIGIVSGIFTVPQLVYKFIIQYTNLKNSVQESELSIPFMVVTGLSTFFSTLLYSVLYIICGFHYYSLAEKKDGKGMLERINEIGVKPNNDVEQLY